MHIEDAEFGELLAHLEGRRRWLETQLPREEIDDVVQRTALALCEKVRDGVRIESPKSYIDGILGNQVCLFWHVRKRVSRLTQHDADALYDGHPSIEDDLIGREDMRGKFVAIESVRHLLSATGWEVVNRFYRRGQSQRQIQSEMGLSDTQFRNHKSRAKAHLTRSIRKQDALSNSAGPQSMHVRDSL